MTVQGEFPGGYACSHAVAALGGKRSFNWNLGMGFQDLQILIYASEDRSADHGCLHR